jgi:AraC-like DNA-binding protein
MTQRIESMDKLAKLLSHFSLQAGIFYTGNMCGMHDFSRDPLRGHLHVIRRGSVRLFCDGQPELDITEPTLIFMPRPDTHRLLADLDSGADVVCGTVVFGGSLRNPITDSLPSSLVIPLAKMPGVDHLMGLMLGEAFAEQAGKQAVLDRLCEILIIHLLRHCMDARLTQGGTLAGLADPRLGKALSALHEAPAQAWTLDDMAKLAGMSRARFAVRFREVTGETPADYLSSWRILISQQLLRRGMAFKQVAHEVGYGSPSAFSRAFARKLGSSPMAWLKAPVLEKSAH